MNEPSADFGADSAVEPGGGGYRATVSGSWSAPPGPNGGYIAALLIRAIEAHVADESRHPRSLAVHYLRPAQIGPVEIGVKIERSGRSATVVTARMVQEEREVCIGICTLATDFESAIDYGTPAPEVDPPERLKRLVAPLPPPIFSQLDLRPTFGDLPFSGSDRALAGGWTKTVVPVQLDAALICLYVDAWWPVPFPRAEGVFMAPTLDLVVHFRSVPPPGDDQFVLARFDSAASMNGFFDENGEIWTRDGVLLAQSRQLALSRPMPEGWAPPDGDGKA